MEKWYKDNQGRSIYGKKFKNYLWSTGQELIEFGFKQSRNKLYVFYYSFKIVDVSGVIWASLGGTSVIPVWQDGKVYLSWKINGPDWKRRQILIRLIRALSNLGIKTRVSFYEEFEVDGNRFFFKNNIPKGFCNCCDEILNNDRIFCCDECKIKYEQEQDKLKSLRDIPSNIICVACGNNFKEYEVVKHHISYIPEETINVCRSCHQFIHKGNKFKNLYPKDQENRKYHKKINIFRENNPELYP